MTWRSLQGRTWGTPARRIRSLIIHQVVVRVPPVHCSSSSYSIFKIETRSLSLDCCRICVRIAAGPGLHGGTPELDEAPAVMAPALPTLVPICQCPATSASRPGRLGYARHSSVPGPRKREVP